MSGSGILIGLQSCNVNNNNPTVPASVPTNTPTFTPTNTPTSTFTPTSSSTPLTPCATQVILSVASGAITNISADYTYADQFSLAAASNFNAVMVTIAGANSSGAGNNLQIAIYSDNGGPSYPVSVLFTSSPHQINSTGSSSVTFKAQPFSLPGGTYWLALHSSVQYQPNQSSSNSAPNFITSGHLPNPFPTPGVASAGSAPWSYSLDTCHP